MAPRLKRKTVEGFDPDASDQAWEAITVLRSKLSSITKFARIVTGNERLTVEITTGVPHTMGNKVFIRPPLGLGAKHEHQRSMCGQREASGMQRCRACQVREVIDFYLFHELAHVIGKTQTRVSGKEFQTAHIEALRLHPQGCPHHDGVIEDIDRARAFGCDAMTLAGMFNPWLPTIINVLEDARVNEMTFISRPGMRRIFEMNLERLLTEGTEVGVDKTASWADCPINSQFMVGLQIQASGADFEGSFDPTVIEALRDPKLVALCSRAIRLGTVCQIFSLAVEVHKRAQELGFCELDPCTVEDEAPDIGSLGTPGGENLPSKGGGGGTEPGDNAEGDSPDRGSDSGEASEGGEGESGSESEESGESSSNSGGSDAESSGSSDDPTSPEGHSAASPSAGVREDGEAGTDRSEPESGGSDPSSETSGSDEPVSSGSDESGTEEGSGGSGDQADGESSDGSADSVVHPDSKESGEGVRESDSTGSESSRAETEGPGEVDAGSESSKLPSSGSDSEPDASTDTGDTAGISGPSGEEGARGRVDQHSPTGEVGTAESGEDEDDPDGHGLQSESLGEQDDVEAGRVDHRDEGTDADDADPGNPWDVENRPQLHHDGDPFDSPYGPVGDPTPEPTVVGTPDDAARDVSKFLMHGTKDQAGLLDVMAADDADSAEHGDAERLIGVPMDDQEYAELMEGILALALGQAGVFDGPSENVVTTEIATFPMRGIRWSPRDTCEKLEISESQLPSIFAPSEELIGAVLLHGRTVFDANKRSHRDTNRRSGKVNTRVLGRRAPVGDDRLFAKKVVPKKRDYFLVLGGDASGSTNQYERNSKIKRSIHAQAELLHRLGVGWAGYMHSAYWSSLSDFKPNGSRKRGTDGQELIWNYLLPFKEEHEAWNDNTKTKLASINPVSQNLDGHTLEAYRKIAMRNTATDRIVVYYTDGEMPAANKEEELEILYREIDLYKRYNIDLVCVGIQTDSPLEYGLPTVRVDSDEDIVKVIRFLDDILTKKVR